VACCRIFCFSFSDKTFLSVDDRLFSVAVGAIEVVEEASNGLV
jgi:hypothetical protein